MHDLELISCSCSLLRLLSLAACSPVQRMLRMLSLAGCLQSEGVIEDNMGARRLLADTQAMCRPRQQSRGIRRLPQHTKFDWRPARSQGPLLNPSSLECLQHTRRCTHIPDAASPVCMLLLGPCSVHVALLPAPPDCCSSAACPPLPAWPGAALAAGVHA